MASNADRCAILEVVPLRSWVDRADRDNDTEELELALLHLLQHFTHYQDRKGVQEVIGRLGGQSMRIALVPQVVDQLVRLGDLRLAYEFIASGMGRLDSISETGKRFGLSLALGSRKVSVGFSISGPTEQVMSDLTELDALANATYIRNYALLDVVEAAASQGLKIGRTTLELLLGTIARDRVSGSNEDTPYDRIVSLHEILRCQSV